MRKSLRILMLIFTLIGMMFVFNQNTYSVTSTSDALNLYDKDVTEAQDKSGVIKMSKKVMGTGISVIRIVGTGIAIIMLTYVAIKYMSAAPNEKAEFKKSATAYIVGAIILFAATNLLKIISDFATSNIG